MHPAVNNVPRRESLLGIILHPGNPFGNNILSRDSLQGILKYSMQGIPARQFFSMYFGQGSPTKIVIPTYLSVIV